MEFDEVVVKESPGLCRCCLSEGCYKDLSTEYTWMNDTEIYADMLLECFDISISQHSDGPNGPNRLICEVCITRLRDACNFKKQVVASEKKFVDMVGRGEFRAKVLVYPTAMKAETHAEDLPADAPEIEYLDDDMDFEDDATKLEDIPEASGSEDITVITLPVKGKRGRPKKTVVKTEKKAKVKLEEKPRTSKAVTKDDDPCKIEEKMIEKKKKDDLANLLTIIIENSTIMPFRWFSNKYMCFYCCCPFVDSAHLKAHTKLEHENIKLKNVLRSILGNTRIKLDVSEIACTKCPKHIRDLDDFLGHIAEAHNVTHDSSQDVINCLYSFYLSDDGMYCVDCRQEFRFFGTLLKHVHKNHNRAHKYICELCGEGFISKANVDGHVKSVHSYDQCVECDEKFHSKYALKNHLRSVHQNKGLKCPRCPEVLQSWYFRSRHLALVHGERNTTFDCDQCSRSFQFQSKLLEHKRRIHLKEKTLACGICGHRVFNKDLLNRHMVKHNDNRPFECDFCKKAFQRKKTLQDHVRIHTNDRRYSCKECGKAFVQVTSLKVHVRVHHSYTN